LDFFLDTVYISLRHNDNWQEDLVWINFCAQNRIHLSCTHLGEKPSYCGPVCGDIFAAVNRFNPFFVNFPVNFT